MSRIILGIAENTNCVRFVDADDFVSNFDRNQNHFQYIGLVGGTDLKIMDRNKGRIYFQTSVYNPASESDSIANTDGITYPTRQDVMDALDDFPGIITAGNSGSVGGSVGTTDAAGALITASKMTTGQYTRYDLDGTNFFDRKIIGTGAVTYSRPDGHDQLTAPATGDAAILQTRQAHPYFAGAALDTLITFSRFELQAGYIKKAGYFSSSYGTPYSANADGIFFESDGVNSVYNLVIAKAGVRSVIPREDWDDKLDGTGASGMVWNPTNFQVFSFDFLYLGGTGVRFGIKNGRNTVWFHTYNHANNFPGTFVGTPQQPIRYEIRNVSGDGSGVFNAICAQVASDFSAPGTAGISRATESQPAVPLAVAGTEYFVRALRLKSGYEKAFVQQLGVSIISIGNKDIDYRVVYNPNISGLVWNGIAGSVLEEARGTSGTPVIISPGQTIFSDFTSGNDAPTSNNYDSLRRLGSDLDGNRDIVALFATPDSNGASVKTHFRWTEFG